MYLLSENHTVFVPPDLSGIVAFNQCDYSTIFIQIDLSQYPQVANSSGTLNCDFFTSASGSDLIIDDFKRELVKKEIMLETD